MKRIVAPSVLSLDFTQMTTQLKRVEVAGASYLHYDVMDGVFVPNISFGPDILRQVHKISDLFLDVHLMIEDPVKYFDAFIDSGAQAITFHVECFENAEDGLAAVKYLKSKGVMAGVTLKPNTDISAILPYLKVVDLVLVMSVEPGFGGQSFIEDMLDRIRQIHEMRQLNTYSYLISVDGGINERTGAKCRQNGADILVAGSYVFGDDIEKAVASLL